MKKRKLYYLEDVLNLVFFYSVFVTLLVTDILSIINCCKLECSWQSPVFFSLMLLVMVVPYIIKKLFRVKISRILTCCFYFIIFASAFLGREIGLYSKISEYDTILHFLCGVYVGMCGISVFLLLNKGNYKNKLLMYVFMVCFVMLVGSLWEIFRYLINLIVYSAPADGYGMLDTIIDMSADFVGSLVAVVVTIFASKYKSDFPDTLKISKLRPSEVEIEEIEE